MKDRVTFATWLSAVGTRAFHVTSEFALRTRAQWRWWRGRRRHGPSFFPALNGVAFETRAHLKGASLAPFTANGGYVQVDRREVFSAKPPKSLGDRELVRRLASASPQVFAAHLRDSVAWGGDGHVLAGNRTLLADVSFARPANFWTEKRKYPILASTSLATPARLSGTYAQLTARAAGWNYFHWMFASVGRLAVLERAGVRLTDLDGYLVNRLCHDVQVEMLVLLGIGKDKVIEIGETDTYRADALWVTGSLFAIGHRKRWICDWHRKNFLRDAPERKPWRRLYISRDDAGRRRVQNEDEVMALLSGQGFEKVVIGDRSVLEQAKLFSEADVIVGTHSSAFANLVFCSPNTRVVDIIPDGHYHTSMWELSSCMNLDYYYAIGHWANTGGRRNREGDTIIPLDRLGAILRLAGVH